LELQGETLLDTTRNDAAGSSAVTAVRALTAQRLSFPCAGNGRRCALVELNEHVRPFTMCNVKVGLVVVIRDNKQGTCMLIDVAITGDRNVIKKRK
jgi:hypothetical protein